MTTYSSTEQGPRGTLATGSVLDRYVVGPVLGRGGFGVVYRCLHRELGIQVAIKEYFPAEFAIREVGRIRPSGMNGGEHFEDGIERFIREGKQLESFRNCPAIASCRDLFRANGTAYMVMDFVRGMPLSKLLALRESSAQPIVEADLLELLLPLLEGLKVIHGSEVYHRDIKPSNILIQNDTNQPVLIDFGAAKQTATGLTHSVAPYTDGYAAPEQIGEGRIGPWTDLYGVGAVMWRAIAGGSPPWNPPNPVTVQRRLYSQITGKDDPMPAAELIGKGRFSPSLLRAVDKCLIVSADERVRSCDELLTCISQEGGLTSVFPATPANTNAPTPEQSPSDSTVRDHPKSVEEIERIWTNKLHAAGRITGRALKPVGEFLLGLFAFLFISFMLIATLMPLIMFGIPQYVTILF